MHQATPLVHEMESDRLFPFFNGLSERYANKSKWKSEVGITPEVVDYLPEDVCEERGEFELKGVKQEVTLYRALPEAAESLKEGEVAA